MSNTPTRQQVQPDAAAVRRKVASLTSAQFPEQAREPGRQIFSFNQDWNFVLDSPGANPLESANGELNWEPVNLPHTPRLEPLNASGGRNWQGVCWYRKTFELDPADSDRLAYLHFEGAMQVADVWLNGNKIFTHFGGYTPFIIDVTPAVDFERTNVLLVRLDNSDNPQVPPGKRQRKLDFTYFGGLYRNVRLELLEKLHISDVLLADKVAGGGTLVTFSDISEKSAVVHVQTHVQNEHECLQRCTVRQEVCATDGAVVAATETVESIDSGTDRTFTQQLRVERPRLWHPYHPHLYTLRTQVWREDTLVDDQAQRIGIRRIHFDKDDGLLINGEKFCAIGANRHQDHPYVGYALPDSAHWRDVKKLREAGFTSVRCHYPQAPAFMDACDELGMVAIVSNPGWQFVGDELFRERAIENARIMVRRDRNRPSVVLWEAALNESPNAPIAADLNRAAHEELPGALTAGDRERDADGNDATGWDVDYLGNDASKPYWIREWGDQVDNWSDQQSSTRVARGWGEGPMLTQVATHISKTNELRDSHHGTSCGPDGKRLAGGCLWAGIDYYRGYHHDPFYGGPLDLFRLPKFNCHFFASQRPPDIHVPGLDDGPMVFIANFATFLSPTQVLIFSNCEQVRLIQNGREIATRSPDPGHRVEHPPFTFKVEQFASEESTMYMTGVAKVGTPFGELRAQGLIGGKVVATHCIRPPGVAAMLRLSVDLCGIDLVADGADWVRVYAEVCDARGTVCPFASDDITFITDGEGSIIGDRETGTNPARAEAGIATALVRSTTRSGRIAVIARAFGLAEAKCEIDSVAPSGFELPAVGLLRLMSRVHSKPCH